MARRQGIRKLLKNIRFTETHEGLRIDLIDEADFAMFAMGTDRLLPQARELVNEVAATIRTMPNPLIVRGHTDGLRSEEHTSELQSLMRRSYAVFCLKKKKTT